jgi:hypothetical protein
MKTLRYGACVRYFNTTGPCVPPFNIAVESLRIGDFTPDEVSTLYKQHTAEDHPH